MLHCVTFVILSGAKLEMSVTNKTYGLIESPVSLFNKNIYLKKMSYLLPIFV